MASWTHAQIGGHARRTSIRLGWERELRLHDLQGDALLELGTGMSGPHYFGHWVKYFYHHWKCNVRKAQDQATLSHFYMWLNVELHRPVRAPEIEEILQTKVANGVVRVKPFDTTRDNLNEIQRFLEGVKYVTNEADRIKYLIRIHGSTIFRRDTLFDTAHTSTVFSGPGWAIWVRSPNGNFYSHSHKAGLFHHSTFLAGGAVLAAGEWQVNNGKITRINGKSGHYRPGMRALWETRNEVMDQTPMDEISLDYQRIDLLYNKSDGRGRFAGTWDLATNAGR